MFVNYNSDSVYKILNRYFCTFLNDRTPYIHIEEKDGKFSINAVSLPETEKISALMKQARILEIMAEKLYEQASISNQPYYSGYAPYVPLFLKLKTETKLQFFAEKIIHSLHENQNDLLSEISELQMHYGQPSFAEALLLQSQRDYERLWQLLHKSNNEIEREWNLSEEDFIISSNSTCSSPSLNPSTTLCNSSSAVRTLKQKIHSITIQELLPQTQEDIDNYNEKKTLKYLHKEKLLAQATLLWGYTHGYMKNKTSQVTVEASEEYRIFSEKEMKPLKEKIALGKITFERIEVLLNQPRPILSALANDICRQMSFTIFNPSQMNIKQGFKPKNKSPQAIRIATIEHFEYLLVCFATHFFPKKREIYLDIMAKWGAAMRDIKIAIEEQRKDLSVEHPSLTYEDASKAFTVFLESLYPEPTDFPNMTPLQQVALFLKSMNQNLCVTPFQSVSIALPSCLGKIYKKVNGRAIEYSFGDHCFMLRTSQVAMIENIYNCEIKVVNLTTCNFIDTFDPWSIRLTVELGIRKENINESQPKLSKEGISNIQKHLIEPLTQCGFKIKISEQLKRIIHKENNPISISNFIFKGKK